MHPFLNIIALWMTGSGAVSFGVENDRVCRHIVESNWGHLTVITACLRGNKTDDAARNECSDCSFGCAISQRYCFCPSSVAVNACEHILLFKRDGQRAIMSTCTNLNLPPRTGLLPLVF